MKGYSSSEVARMLGMSAGQVRSYVRSGFLQPARGARRALLFSFQDVVLLRTAKGLVEARIGARKVKRILKELKERLPSGRPLASVSIVAEGNRVVIREGTSRWTTDGQGLFDFDVGDLARKVKPIVSRAAEAARGAQDEQSAEDWYDLACHLELYSREEARDAYRRTVELDPHHANAHVNLGRLLHEAGELEAAEAHYRLALAASPDASIAAFDLGVVLEDLDRQPEAIEAYERALGTDPSCADAHFNVARLYEKAGKMAAALRHFNAYQRLTRDH